MIDKIKAYLESLPEAERQQAITDIKKAIAPYSNKKHNPVDNVMWVNFNQVEANNYNPNAVAKQEMKLLHTSIIHDGYTQPIVTIYDPEKNKYVIVDGFHRYATMVYSKDLQELDDCMVPIVVIDKGINDRMASTIRHNRARGKHSIEGMSNIVLNMLKNDWSDERICNELGLEPEELIRLKFITGYAKLYEDKVFSKAWETEHQVAVRRDYEKREQAQVQMEETKEDNNG